MACRAKKFSRRTVSAAVYVKCLVRSVKQKSREPMKRSCYTDGSPRKTSRYSGDKLCILSMSFARWWLSGCASLACASKHGQGAGGEQPHVAMSKNRHRAFCGPHRAVNWGKGGSPRVCLREH
eukprot:6183211-Pleurochrysis_carterae.AAC.3